MRSAVASKAQIIVLFFPFLVGASEPGVAAQIKAYSVQTGRGERLLVDIELKNQRGVTVRMAIRSIFSNCEVTGRSLRVRSEAGEEVDYLGRISEGSDYEVLRPNRKFAIRGLDITDSFDFSTRREKLRISFSTVLRDERELIIVESPVTTVSFGRTTARPRFHLGQHSKREETNQSTIVLCGERRTLKEDRTGQSPRR